MAGQTPLTPRNPRTAGARTLLLALATAGAAMVWSHGAQAQDLKYTIPDTALVDVGDAQLTTLKDPDNAVLIARVQYYRALPAEEEAAKEVKAAKKALKGLKSNRKAAIAEVDAAKTNNDKARKEKADKLLEERERELEAGEARIQLAQDKLALAKAKIYEAAARLDAAGAARELARAKLVEAAGGKGAKRYDLEDFVAQLNEKEKALTEAMDDREELEARVHESEAKWRSLTQ